MYKIFYHPETLKIQGYSDGEKSMDFPFVTSKIEPFLLDNWKVEIVKGKPKLSFIKGTYTDDEWKELTN